MPLYLVRHGESTGNAQGIYQCQLDYPLSECGVGQAGQLGAWLAGRGQRFDAVYASTLDRAAHTARVIAQHTASPEPLPEPRLMEYHGGKLSGLTHADFERDFPEFARRGFEHWGDLSVYGGESLSDMELRLRSFMDEIEARHNLQDEHVLAVAHGGSLHHLIKLLVTYPTPRVTFTHLSNCTLVRLDKREAGGKHIYAIRWVMPLELITI
jgi:broad specificity phosphatase PhoE